MANENLISHTIQIAGESYPVRLTEEEKEFAIEIESELNEKISEFKIKYLVKTTKDILAMILLTYAFEAKKKNENSDGLEIANEKVERLLELISNQVQ
ncbi:MAG: cell division protein ZapA [Saprospiraceae bacterium]|nr:cell division protein ZapA [Bacteroidia bacterium]NNE14497.1 cell division protein ZapA [Saprospiraceae bacterium]NNL92680.1 cell division protein ZapA [Saprospiraceae bacterium]